MMGRFGVAAVLAWLCLATGASQFTATRIQKRDGFTTSTALTAASTYSPTNVWTVAPACSSGSTAQAQQGGYGGGVYQDAFGTYWVRTISVARGYMVADNIDRK